jgi:hypothetical protein
MPLSSWVFETVESASDGMTESAQEAASRTNSLAEENRKLRRDIEKSEARLRELETQIFKLQHDSFIHDLPGEKIYSEKIIEVLRSGGIWPGRKLLEELDINPDDAKSIQIVSKQLEVLQDFKLVSENARGWMWIE